MGRGHSVLRAAEANLGGQDDRTVAIYAAHDKRVLVTGNLRHYKPLVVELEELQVVTFRADQAQFLVAVTEAYADIVQRLSAGERWIVLRREPIGRRKRQYKWVIADPSDVVPGHG